MPHAVATALAVGVVLGVCASLLLYRFYFPSYLREKGKNLATKEDVGEITAQIESIKADHALALEAVRSTNSLRHAALDRRLEVAQEAYALWWKLLHTVHTDEIGKTCIECQEWWGRSCLYLSPESRETFRAAYGAAHGHKDLLDTFRGMRDPDGADVIAQNFAKITAVGPILEESVELPPLKESVVDVVADPESGS